MTSGEEHPDGDMFGYMTCPFCSTHLHGHGWRRRYLEKEPESFVRIWIHRKKCPKCRRTYTLIPEGMAAISQYPLDRIREALAYRHSHGHCSRSLFIPLLTQKRWWRNFTIRVRAECGMFPAKEETAAAISILTPLSTLPLGWILTKDSAELRAVLTRQGPPHHIMFLPQHLVP